MLLLKTISTTILAILLDIYDLPDFNVACHVSQSQECSVFVEPDEDHAVFEGVLRLAVDNRDFTLFSCSRRSPVSLFPSPHVSSVIFTSTHANSIQSRMEVATEHSLAIAI